MLLFTRFITVLFVTIALNTGEISMVHAETDCRCEYGDAGYDTKFISYCNSIGRGFTEIPKDECDTLLKFYNMTNGPNWSDKEGWNVTNHPCQWHGMSCNQVFGKSVSTSNLAPEVSKKENRVYQIVLYDNNLSGSIPDLSKLKDLNRLMLRNNNLSGSIPNLNELTNLDWIDFSCNQFTGNVPYFNKLTKLRILTLSQNQLTGDIPDFSKLKNLKALDLSDNELEGEIDISKFPDNLEAFIINNNQMTGTIPDFSKLKNLKDLSLCGNQLCRDKNIDYSHWYSAMVYPICGSDEHKNEEYPSCMIITDPACSDDVNCYGEFLKEVGENEVRLIDNVSKLTQSNVLRTGVVTDGVTLLLITLPLQCVSEDESVIFTLKQADSSQCKLEKITDLGMLMKRDDNIGSSSIEVKPESMFEGMKKVNISELPDYTPKVAFAVYQPPNNFPCKDVKNPLKIIIEAVTASGEKLGSQVLKLYPPPVLLIHGIWDSPNSYLKSINLYKNI